MSKRLSPITRRAISKTTIRCIARLRLRNPSYIIPAISALNLVSEDGYVRALRAGANLATINLTPSANRKDYLLYKRDRFIMHEQRVKDAIAQAGCAISTVSIAETMRQKMLPSAGPAVRGTPARKIRAAA